jgi:hypothetical protein
VSQWEQIFFDADGTLDEVGTTLATALRLRATVRGREVDVFGEPGASGLLTPLSGTVEPNIYAETAPEKPSDVSVFDDMPWVLEFLVRKSDFHLQRDTALLLFRRMASALGWRSALTSEYARLVATQDAVHGYREYPEDTLADATHADRWR